MPSYLGKSLVFKKPKFTLQTNDKKLDLYTQIGETIADKTFGKPLPAIRVEEPTVKMAFSINTSPFVGREVCQNKYMGTRFAMYKHIFQVLSNRIFSNIC